MMMESKDMAGEGGEHFGILKSKILVTPMVGYGHLLQSPH